MLANEIRPHGRRVHFLAASISGLCDVSPLLRGSDFSCQLCTSSKSCTVLATEKSDLLNKVTIAPRSSEQSGGCDARDTICSPWRMMLQRLADPARKAVKLAEPYKPYARHFLEFYFKVLHFLSTCQTWMKRISKHTKLALPIIFLPALSAHG